jgi:hypothetical protein
MKDWTGNTKAVFVPLGASNHSAHERQAHDFYATSPKAVSQLLDAEVFTCDILEPCCGAGHIAKVLTARGYNVKAQDLYDYGYGESGVDFLAYNKPFNGDVITNPPYKYATEFVTHALELIPPPCRVAMFLRLQFLEGAIRYKDIFSRGGLERVYVSSRRSHCAMNGDFENMKGNAICYAWFIWRKGYEGEPTIRWFNTPTRKIIQPNLFKERNPL